MEIKPEHLRKLEVSSIKQDNASGPGEHIEAIFKVSKPDYVPPQVRLRSRVDATMFTGECPASALQQIESDPNVVSVAPSKKLRFID